MKKVLFMLFISLFFSQAKATLDSPSYEDSMIDDKLEDVGNWSFYKTIYRENGIETFQLVLLNNNRDELDFVCIPRYKRQNFFGIQYQEVWLPPDQTYDLTFMADNQPSRTYRGYSERKNNVILDKYADLINYMKTATHLVVKVSGSGISEHTVRFDITGYREALDKLATKCKL